MVLVNSTVMHGFHFSVISMSALDNASVELDQSQHLAHIDSMLAGVVCTQPSLRMPLAVLAHGGCCRLWGYTACCGRVQCQERGGKVTN